MLGLTKEQSRIAALKNFQILDTMPEREFDDLTLLASQICETPIALISLIDENRQWFKSRVGLSATETPRDMAFCDHAINGDDLFIVTDPTKDERFASNPLVTKDLQIRFYAGAPLTTSDGHNLGTLCVIDSKPRQLNDKQKRALNTLARTVINLLETRREMSAFKNLTAAPTANSSIKDKVFENADSTGNLFKPKKDITEELSFFNRYLKHYLIATLIIIVTMTLKMVLESIIQVDAPVIFFACAVLLAAWRGGFGAGLYTTLVGVLIIDYFFMPPLGDLFGHTFGQDLRLLIFIAQGILISLLCASRIRSEQLLRHAGTELESRVSKRTNQLARAISDLQQEVQERRILQEDLQQARDEALESARQKSEFLANMSHEIRTPMNGVIGVTGLLLETKLDDEQKRFTEIIRSSGESLLTVINDILDFSKVEAGKLELEILDFDLRETIESTIELFSNAAQAKNNELAMLIYSDVPLKLSGDAGRIRQILSNLVSNAIKFTKQGDIVVRVKKTRETSTNVQLNFSVTDTGEGISKKVQAKLFQPFTQSDASTTRRFGGTGLGLSISKRLVEMMDGQIGIESEDGKGATFWFDITLNKQKMFSTAYHNELKSVLDHSELNHRQILIVDDNAVNREVLVYQTQSWGMQVQEAANGMEAIAVLDKHPIELIILDLQMPDIDGLETAYHIVAGKNQDAVPPIIMMLSSGLKVNEETMQELGIKAFLTKPYRQDDLLDTIYKTLKLNKDETSANSDIHIPIRPETEILPQSPERSKRILLVEDNQVNQLVAQAQLKKIGYQADVVANGIEALRALEILPYDLVLMDCQMPEMDGYEATRAIRARNWKVSNIPIIALTAHAIEGEREKCLQAGMNDYISKPVEKEALQQIINHWLLIQDDNFGKDTVFREVEYFMLNEKNEITTEQVSETTAEIVNFETLDDITGYDAEMRREVVEMYLAQTTIQLSEIERAISVNDMTTLYNMAHKTVGSSAICGMMAIVEPMRKLEHMGREGITNEAAPVLAQARQAFVSINEQCREILEG